VASARQAGAARGGSVMLAACKPRKKTMCCNEVGALAFMQLMRPCHPAPGDIHRCLIFQQYHSILMHYKIKLVTRGFEQQEQAPHPLGREGGGHSPRYMSTPPGRRCIWMYLVVLIAPVCSAWTKYTAYTQCNFRIRGDTIFFLIQYTASCRTLH
jgi:hypothetical protein